MSVCLVTGCAGFVGSHLSDALIKQGHKVIGVDNLFSGDIENIRNCLNSARFSFYERDIRDSDLLSHIKKTDGHIDVIFHLAAIVSVPYCESNPEVCEEVNHHSSISLYKQSKELGVSQFIFAGSAAEYGNNQSCPINEEAKTAPINQYGMQKSLVSKFLKEQVNAIVLRFFNIYGPGQQFDNPYSGVVSKMISALSVNKSIEIHGDGQQTRDFIHIHDTIDSYLLSLTEASKNNLAPGIYNVGTGNECKIIDLATNIATIMGESSKFNFIDSRANDILKSFSDISKISKYGYQTKYDINQGLKDTINWFLNKT